MPGIITIQIENSPYNSQATLYGNLTRDGWTVVKRGFKYGASTPPTTDKYDSVDEDGEYYLTTASNLIAYTKYYYKAYADLKFWEVNEEFPEGHWIYETVNGDILFFYTNAIANVINILAIDATKNGGNESIKFIGYLEDNADNKVSARGFKYGLTKADTWNVSEAVGSEGSFNLIATGIAGDVDIYFRAFATTPTGDYFGEYEKASTKIFNPVIFMLVNSFWAPYAFYLTAFDHNGNIYNAWELIGEYWDANCIYADDDGNTYAIKDQTTIIKRNKNGAVVATKGTLGVAYSIAFKPSGYLAVRGLYTDMQYLREYDTDLNHAGISILSFTTNSYAYTGLAVDNEGYTYTINRLTDKIEKWDWQEEWELQEDVITESDVDTDTNILSLSIDIQTGAIVTFWEDTALPSPLIEWDYYYVIKTSENHIKLALTESDALAGIAIDLTTQGEGDNEIFEVSAIYKKEKVAERDLSGVYSGNYNYLSIAGNLIYSNEYGGQGWTIPTTLLEDPANWTPSNGSWIRSLSSLGGNRFILSGISDTTGNYVIFCYNSSKEFLWESETYYHEIDFYSLTGIRNFEAELINTKAERDSTQTSIRLYGEITKIVVPITEKGFEYIVQDEEPAPDATGIEVIKERPAWIESWDVGEYWAYEYEGNDVSFHDRLYNLEENTIWWFRAICKDDGENKYTAATWMKNLPNVITQDMTNINYNKADGNGLIVSEGASELTVRGFEVIHEFSGRLPNSWRFEIGGFEGEPEQVVVYDSFGVFIIDFYWAGTLIKTVIETYELEEGHFDITIGRMILGWPVMDDCLVEGKDYRCIAFAENEFGRAYGEEVDFSTWARTYF